MIVSSVETSVRSAFDPRRHGTAILAFALFTVALAMLFWSGLVAAHAAWSREEYSYGYVVPFIAVYLLLRALPEALQHPVRHAWLGAVLAVFAVAFGLLGGLGKIPDLSGYGFIMAVAAGFVAALGLPAALRLWQPLIYLVFMLPLPQIVYLKLSAGLQLVSSKLGVLLVRLMDIPVLLEGNVIDLGTYQLLVAEACSGLRYLFPLMSFGFLFAVLYRGRAWHKWLLFLSTIPLTIGMNSLRIAAIGLLVNSYGIEMAEGFLHYFQGWVVFLGCIAVLFVEAILLLRLTGSKWTLAEALDFKLSPLTEITRPLSGRGMTMSFGMTVGLLAAGLLALHALSIRDSDAVPSRQKFVNFPSRIGDWKGTQESIPQNVMEVLAANDYLLANYADGSGPVNLFMTYYDNQTDGRAVHSPEVCIPGDGWEIQSLKTYRPVIPGGSEGFAVNRAVIQKGLSKALVYFWFEVRGRKVTSGYMAKWHILWDGIAHNRTDGGLVRLVTALPRGGSEADADAHLARFIGAIAPSLPAFLPE